MPHVVGWVKWQ